MPTGEPLSIVLRAARHEPVHRHGRGTPQPKRFGDTGEFHQHPVAAEPLMGGYEDHGSRRRHPADQGKPLGLRHHHIKKGEIKLHRGKQYPGLGGGRRLPRDDDFRVMAEHLPKPLADQRLGSVPCYDPPEYPWESDPTTWAELELTG